MKALKSFIGNKKRGKAPIVLNLSHSSKSKLKLIKSNYDLDLSDLSSLSNDEKKLLAVILHDVAGKAGKSAIPKLSKNIPLSFTTLEGKKITVTLSHTLRQSTREGEPVFNIMIPKSEQPVLGSGTYGVVKKFVNLIKLTEEGGIKEVEELRVNKKQICEEKTPEAETAFRQRVEAETRAAKALYGEYDVDAHWFSRNRNGNLIAHQSLPFAGENSQQYFEKLSLNDQLFAVSRLANQLNNFHKKGYAHRDIKPANIMLDMKKKALVAVDPGFAMYEGEKKCYAGTPVYMPSAAVNAADADETLTLDVNEARKLDVYALGLTIAELFGVPSGVIDNISQWGDGAIDFHDIKIADPKIKEELISLLIEMAQADYEKVPSMEACAKRLGKLAVIYSFAETADKFSSTLKNKVGNNKAFSNEYSQLENNIQAFKKKAIAQLDDNGFNQKKYKELNTELKNLGEKLDALITNKEQQTWFFWFTHKVPVVNCGLGQRFYSFWKPQKSLQAEIPKIEATISSSK